MVMERVMTRDRAAGGDGRDTPPLPTSPAPPPPPLPVHPPPVTTRRPPPAPPPRRSPPPVPLPPHHSRGSTPRSALPLYLLVPGAYRRCRSRDEPEVPPPSDGVLDHGSHSSPPRRPQEGSGVPHRRRRQQEPARR